MAQEQEQLHDSIAEIRKGLALVGRDLNQIGSRRERNNNTRLSLLHIHAITAFCVGLGVIANGAEGISTPAYAGVRLVPGAPLTVGLILLILGVVLGTATYRRMIRTEIAALIGMLIWYALWASSFAYAMIIWQLDPVGLRPSWQGMFAYWGWAAMIAVHVNVLIWIDRSRKRGSA